MFRCSPEVLGNETSAAGTTRFMTGVQIGDGESFNVDRENCTEGACYGGHQDSMEGLRLVSSAFLWTGGLRVVLCTIWLPVGGL